MIDAFITLIKTYSVSVKGTKTYSQFLPLSSEALCTSVFVHLCRWEDVSKLL